MRNAFHLLQEAFFGLGHISVVTSSLIHCCEGRSSGGLVMVKIRMVVMGWRGVVVVVHDTTKMYIMRRELHNDTLELLLFSLSRIPPPVAFRSYRTPMKYNIIIHECSFIVNGICPIDLNPQCV